MAVRRQCNRYKTEPFGSDEQNVIKRAKAFFKDGEFMITKYGLTYCSSRLPLNQFKTPLGARIFKKINGRWFEQ